MKTDIKNNDFPVRLPLCNRSSSLEELYTLMLAIRKFELSLLAMFEKGLLTGTTHTCLGQEASAVGVVSSIDRRKDIIFSNHRGHGHFLSYCGEIEALYLEIMGKPGGICAGRGGSQQLHYRNFYSNGILGSIAPVSTGMALAEKLKNTKSVVIVFLGDGALGEGVVYESFNMASLWKLPILFVIENNGYAQSTPNTSTIAGEVRRRPEAFGIAVKEGDGTDVLKVLSLASEATHLVRSERRPYCLHLRCERLGPHSKGDDVRSHEEILKARKRDPLKAAQNMLDESILRRIDKRVSCLVNTAKERALKGTCYESE